MPFLARDRRSVVLNAAIVVLLGGACSHDWNGRAPSDAGSGGAGGQVEQGGHGGEGGQGGQETTPCDGAATRCGAECVDLATDPRSCGACFEACAPGELCSDGVCCPPDRAVCSGACVDLRSRSDNCGACGAACAEGERCANGACEVVQPTCAAILASGSSTGDGVYFIDPDGVGGAAPIQVFCDMTAFGGGFTLVGQERPGAGETMRFLGVETTPPDRLLAGDSGLFGVRLAGLYSEVMITWQDGGRFLRFRPLSELFDNTQLLFSEIQGFETNDPALAGWVTEDGGAGFCRAAVAPDLRPGDTSWAIKPLASQDAGCGCNSGGWSGRGAFYGGSSDCNACSCWGPASFVGAQDVGERKSDLTAYTTQILVR